MKRDKTKQNVRAGIDLTLDYLLSLQQNNIGPMQQLKPASASLAGRFRSRLKGRGMEFDEVRQYQPGDDIRTIDWRVTARTGETHTKVFSEERERPIIVMLDLSSSMRFGSQRQLKSYQAASLAAQLLWSASKEGDRFGALVFNEQSQTAIKAKQRSSTLMHIFSKIIEQHQQLINQSTESQADHTLFNTNIKHLRHVAKTGALIHIISDFAYFDEQSKKTLSLLNRHNQVLAWKIQDPLEVALPNNKGGQTFAVTNGVNQGIIQVGNKRQSDKYQAAAALINDQLSNNLRKIGIPIFPISTHLELKQQIGTHQSGFAPRSKGVRK